MIFIISGQTASGKTSLALLLAKLLQYQRLISHTTRPMRIGETNGVEYHFISNAQLNETNLICKNTFHTAYGPWTYGLDIEGIDENKHHIAILEAAGAVELKSNIPSAKIIYIDVPETIRRERAYVRENKQFDPEIERRFKADAEDFTGFENKADLTVLNINFQDCVQQIKNYIEQSIGRDGVGNDKIRS